MTEFLSTAFDDGQPIPPKNTAEGGNLSPGLIWRGEPDGTQEMALIVENSDDSPDAPYVNWVVYKIPPVAGALAEGDNGGALEGKNSRGEKGYLGPLPPPGQGPYQYHFKLFALDKKIDSGPGLTRDQLLQVIQGHVLEQKEIVGTYARSATASDRSGGFFNRLKKKLTGE